MRRFLQFLFKWPVAGLVGIVAVTVLVLELSVSDSTHSFIDHLSEGWIASQPLTPDVVYFQEVNIPDAFSGRPFILALFFGHEDEDSFGGVEVTLSQSNHIQTLIVSDMAPSNIHRHRFRFSGFDGGSAMLRVSALGTNTASAPGLFYISSGEEPSLQGPEIPDNVYAAIDWFKITMGSERLGIAFPSLWVGLLWLFPFAGVIALAWKGMEPIKAE